MRIMFFYNVGEDVGSAQTIHGYSRAARALGHEVAVYRQHAESNLNYSLDVESADAVIFVLEWWLEMEYAGYLNLVRLMSKVPRERRVIMDNDGMYNDVVRVGDDYNHSDEAGSIARTELYDSISDKIFQPTYHPLRSNVGTFLFHAYNPPWEVPLDFSSKEYGMFYVGNNWFRWNAMRRVLEALRPIRKQVGRIGVAGWSWSAMPHWVESPLREVACYTDPAYLKQVGVEVLPPVQVTQVISAMSKGIFSPVLVRPLFNRLRLVNPRLFETIAANTIPLFDLDSQYVREIYGEEAVELVLPSTQPDLKILDIVQHPERYVRIVKRIRRHLADNHSYSARFQELCKIIKN